MGTSSLSGKSSKMLEEGVVTWSRLVKYVCLEKQYTVVFS